MSHMNEPRQFGRKSGGDSHPEQVLETVTKELKRIGDEVKSAGEKALAEAKRAGDLGVETKATVDELLIKQGELQARLLEAEQKLARGGGSAELETPKTLGQLVTESEEMKGMDGSARKSVRVRVDRKSIMNVPATVGSGVSGSNSLVVADRQAGIIAPPQRKMTIRDLLMPGQTSSSSIEYTVETGFTNNAAAVAEGAQKPTSDLKFNLKNQPVRTIAHLFKASRQILDDAPALQSYIDGRARYGLQLTEEGQILKGDGTGANILGILPQASAFMPSITLANATPIDKIRLALLQAVLAEFSATGIVLNPIDWASIELTKDSQGRYIVGNPVNGTTPRLWNLPVVETQAMTANEFLVGAFSMAAQIFDRMEIEVLLSTENVDDFEKNMVSIRAEERLALAVYRPESFVTGALVEQAGG
ncbi:Phage major capsid protein [Burkholderia pseudomallei]|uniref:phage major capsid protein n=1 Tax=Burkholderia pseudomallei TaxID=28450 RepID=UPI0005E7DF17|nr:phage major capsid protein [Burkholderia pseudomallei]MBF3788672.1 phage major capsid protein [Burkholderia pseudomallei]CAJ3428758.1 Phage major capsid protein [Burkholderia pseudomallei]CAJ3481292.1 Phage major capsid protein [Burkholderia pseudomallei]CAJ3914290.1 Phage major capsid protein [Burkholderia pseudomallei]CAJ4718978.1 Phage major capsid protein [Burkholderia pseudomallei]